MAAASRCGFPQTACAAGLFGGGAPAWTAAAPQPRGTVPPRTGRLSGAGAVRRGTSWSTHRQRRTAPSVGLLRCPLQARPILRAGRRSTRSAGPLHDVHHRVHGSRCRVRVDGDGSTGGGGKAAEGEVGAGQARRRPLPQVVVTRRKALIGEQEAVALPAAQPLTRMPPNLAA